MTVGALSSSGQYINIDSLVSNATLTQQQRVTDLQTQQTTNSTSISTLGKAKSTLSSLEDKYKAINTAFSNVTVSGTPDGATVTATGKGLYSVSVDSLASTQIISSKDSHTKDALGYSGTLTINNGSYDSSNAFTQSQAGTAINISATDTLADIAKKINDTGSGVTASIINGDDGQHLSFSSTSTGAANGFQITTTDPDTTGLSSLSYTQGGVNSFTNVNSAQDGKATVNGVSISSADNNFTVSDTFAFKATDTFASKKINVTRDDTSVTKAINDFVTAYNSATTSLKGMAVDNQLKNFTTSIRNTLGKADYTNSVASLGISFDKTGVMSFDSAKYTKYAATTNNNLSNIVSSQFGAKSATVALFDNEVQTGGALDSQVATLTTKGRTLTDNIAKNTDILTAQTTAYQLQFSKLDQYLSQLNDNSNSITKLIAQFSTTT